MAGTTGEVPVLSREDWGSGFLVGGESGGGVFDAELGVSAADSGELVAVESKSGLFGGESGDICVNFGVAGGVDGVGGV